MMRIVAASLVLLIGATALAPFASADGRAEKAVAYRQGIFKVMGWNVGVIAGMARGDRAYDAADARAAANALAALGPVMPGAFHPETRSKRTLAAIWDRPDDFQAAIDAYLTASAALVDVAGDGEAGLRSALGPFAASCKNCHDDFRGPR